MTTVKRDTLARWRDDLGGFAWGDAEIDELVDPRRGIITGYSELLEGLRAIGRLPLPGLHAGDD